MKHDDYAELGRILAHASLDGRGDDWRRERIAAFVDAIEARHAQREAALRQTMNRMVTRAGKASRAAAGRRIDTSDAA